MITNDKGIVELKHFILREICRLAWNGRLTAEETEKNPVSGQSRTQAPVPLLHL